MLRWYQTEACDAAWDSLLQKRGNPLIDLPTGSGKSWVIAELARRAVQDYAGRVVVLAHRKELLKQNADKIQTLSGIEAGIYSAGLNSRNTNAEIIVGGIQSIYSRASELGRRHLVIIDEAHLTPQADVGMFRQFLSDLERYNPKLKIIGLTATPFRLDSGRLWGKDELFSHLCYRADIRKLIDEGHLCKLLNKPSDTHYDTSGLHTRLGEFIRREVEDLFSDSALVQKSCQELAAKAAGRNSVLVFCSGVDHASHVTETLAEITGERVECVTGETPQLIREGILEGFTSGDFRFCVNVDVLTTGFDNPRIDCVAIMRATQSAGLFCQMVGRGLRTHPSKQDALIIDFGGNLRRHGPIDAIDFASKKKSEATVDAPEKKCPACGEMVPAGTRVCECGLEFIFNKAQHDAEPDTESQILSEPVEFEVSGWQLTRHFKKNDDTAPNTLRVTYFLEGNLESVIEEWVCLNHEGFAFKKAMGWWAKHSSEDLEIAAEVFSVDFVGAALEIWRRGYIRRPVRITAIRDGKWWRVTDRVIGDLEPRANEEEIPF